MSPMAPCHHAAAGDTPSHWSGPDKDHLCFCICCLSSWGPWDHHHIRKYLHLTSETFHNLNHPFTMKTALLGMRGISSNCIYCIVRALLSAQAAMSILNLRLNQ